MLEPEKQMTSVSIVHCDDYTNVKEAVARSLELIGGQDNIVHLGDRVLLKVNLLSARPPEDTVTTHPSVVSAVIELVQDAGGIPIVGDGAGMVHPGATAEALEVSGTRKYDVDIRDPATGSVVGRNTPIDFEFTTGTFIFVPPGLKGVGDKLEGRTIENSIGAINEGW